EDGPRRCLLHSELHGGGPAADRGVGDLAVTAVARRLGVGDHVDPPIPPRHPTAIRARDMMAGPSSAATASINAARNVPGPGACSAASSAATSNHTSPAVAAASGSGST